ncbi:MULTISPECIES: shikimate dehydrogenase [Rhodomicrobium]|uniref:shikimate dehydrogenase n=1 Tax=Rhodomicrobium TaxID=1068 RepID=UPI000B4BC948|nr:MULTISPECIES: shikimate dehydrogenase [Rhodomicrobium]
MKRACVAGWPVAHSRSPLIHGYWLKSYGIDGDYVRRPVTPDEAPEFFRDLAGHGFAGCNVTVPHKETAFRAAARPDAAARSVEAANTLWLEDGVLCASNTDIYGFLANLDDRTPGWDETRQPVAVLGAGGAARGIIRGLLDRGFQQIRLANRTRDRAEALAAIFGPAIAVYDWEQGTSMLKSCALVVNTTTLGMTSAPPLVLDLSPLAPYAVVNDIVYAPLETDLLRRARASGFRVADGLGMLLHQAVPGFEKWFGIRPEVTPELRALIIADLNAH